MNLATGQRVPLASLQLQSDLEFRLQVSGAARDYAAVCFVLGADSRLTGPDPAISAGQPRGAGGSVTWQSGGFLVNLDHLPAGAERLAFAVVPENGDLRGVQRGELSIAAPGGQPAASWTFAGADFSQERAIIAAELYRHQGAWRLMINGQGFADGLSGLVRHFGGSQLPELRPAAPPPPTPSAAPQPGGLNLSRPASPSAAAGPAPASRPISLTKITLDKPGQSARISLQKAGTQRVHVNLNWDVKPSAAPAPGGGFLSKLLGSVSGAGKAADLDLGCMYELASGEKGVIQALGGNFGVSGGPPFIKLDQDDRSGASAQGENLYIERPDLIRKVLIFAFIYEGAGNFSDVNGRLSFNDPQGNEVKMQLSNPAALPFCAVALVQAHGGELVITKEERYFSGHRDCDQAFGFGFSWKAGRK
ncbi:tellurium resistance protein TerA [Deinococcus irradiatisoli]|uniref:Tellurium resistance protein TerA n=1 Tax=Deinococcus irradiatisoli TaxID=2202254 RepID=A0A2Z3JEV2_9DEIO|nr:TerD family protein [Deinococcus irradiatisoli]AWN21920.1 tellurium resistance protein TerA [Deinococcus irradiatisoli]